jgi:copper homeostasis protein (lipoprotein)
MALCGSLAAFAGGCMSKAAPAGRGGAAPGIAAGAAAAATTATSARRLQGLYSYMADAGMFVECETGQRLPVVQEADNAALEAAYSAARPTPGAALLAVVDGRIENREPMEGPARPMLIVDRFLSIAPGSCSDGRSTASLENTYWKLMRLGSQPVTVADGQREPHFVLQSETRRVTGSGGCNRMAGSYTLEGSKISFSQMAGTMMACPDGMDVERAFHTALQTVSRWHIDGETLALFDAAGESVASFESRYMR